MNINEKGYLRLGPLQSWTWYIFEYFFIVYSPEPKVSDSLRLLCVLFSPLASTYGFFSRYLSLPLPPSLSLSILFHFLRFLFWLSFSVFLGDRMRKECRKLESKIFSWKRYFLARKRETKIFSWKFWSKLGQNPR